MAGSVGQYTQGWFPWVAVKSTVGTWTRYNDTAGLGMGDWGNNAAHALNDEFAVDRYFDSVTWKYATLYISSTNRGIETVQFNGSSIGTVDMYAGATAWNVYAEITGISVATAGVKTVKFITVSKNASSTGYVMDSNSKAFIATSGTYSTPAGTDTPGYTWELFPYMGTKGNTQWAYRQQSSSALAGGYLLQSPTAQNNEWNTDLWLEARTYKFALVHLKDTDNGIHTIKLDGSSVGTIDAYAASSSLNNYSEITGIAVATAGVKNMQDIAATKNASSSNYNGGVQSAKWISTGA